MTETPEKIVASMMSRDKFSQWLGIAIERVDQGSCVVSMTLRDEMVNGFGIAHGGIAYALADSAMAFASNTHGQVAVALTNTTSYPAAVRTGDKLVATATEVALTRRTGIYDVVVSVDRTIVCVFRGTVFRKDEKHSQTSDD